MEKRSLTGAFFVGLKEILFVHAEASLELIDAAADIDELLSARKERMALGADFNPHVLLRGACFDERMVVCL